ncbi:MAG TPA: prolyl oligopeptidase family serine peptidase [Acidobacteriota bacterium]
MKVINQSKIQYPKTRKEEIVQDYHGTRIRDPYQWLERADDPETIQWVEAQNALTRSLLDRPERTAIKNRLIELYDFPRYSTPFRRGKYYLFSRNAGLQNQPVLFVQEGLRGEARVLLDPNELSAEGTVALTSMAVSSNGSLLVYGLSRSGSDVQELYVRSVESGIDLQDKLIWVKFTSLAWTHDSQSFYYTRFPQPGSVPPGDENYFCKIYRHTLGTDQSQDQLIYERPDDREIVFIVDITDDDRYLMIGAYKGSSDRSEWYALDRISGEILPLFAGFEHAYHFIEETDGRFYFLTDRDAPLGRIISVDAAGQDLRQIVPQSEDKLSSASVINRRIIALYLRNASGNVRIYSLEGSQETELSLPAIGSISALSGEPGDTEMFIGFQSFTYAPTSFRYDFDSRRLEPFFRSEGKVDPEAYETKQVWYASRDGTPVSMFLVHKKGLQLRGQSPTLLYGYGGFNVPVEPVYNPAIFLLLEKGGVCAAANLRGGSEYGEAWHQAGMLHKKQNVFDDFVAAAEWLIAGGYTCSAKLAIRGGSNGGLLVGATMVQRPELAAAVVCQVPVVDMLRYHLATVGRFWIPEYGSAEDPEHFQFLLKYSPYHNVQDGVAYPATLITTADTDDRVDPGMAKKFAARLQEASSGANPILIRVEIRAGHGAGKPMSKVIEEAADVYTFLFWRLGVSKDFTTEA